MSVELTRPFPDTSPSSTLIGMATLPEPAPPVTPSKLMVRVCALLTLVKLTVTWVLRTVKPFVGAIAAVPPVPGVTVTFDTLTGTENVTTTV